MIYKSLKLFEDIFYILAILIMKKYYSIDYICIEGINK